MFTLLSLSQYNETPLLEMLKNHNLGLFKHGWYVEMDEPDNLYLNLSLFYLDEEGIPSRVAIFTSTYPISDNLLRVQVEVIEGDTCFILHTDIWVCNFQPNLMKSGLGSDLFSL